ncbi:MAG: cell envelope integrity protein TolA [Thermodesulfovibrionaceae bacterium]
MTKKFYFSLFLSIFSHIVFLLLILFSIKNLAQDFKKNLTYVSLIYYEERSIRNLIEKKSEQKVSIQKPVEKTEKVSKNEELLKERLHALMAKKRVFEKLQAGSVELSGQKESFSGISNSYLLLISERIRQKWVIPDTIPKTLEAVVSVRILANGDVFIEGFEKSSGNTIFDSSVIRAIRNSSPLPPPKREILVGLRFKP